jgi:antitoxin component of MazEF toxin-antitoxin module
MVRKLFRAGNSVAVAIPGTALSALGLAEGDYVRLEHDAAAGALLLWPHTAHERLGLSSEYVRQIGEFLRDYGAALAALEAADATPSPPDAAPAVPPDDAPLP